LEAKLLLLNIIMSFQAKHAATIEAIKMMGCTVEEFPLLLAEIKFPRTLEGRVLVLPIMVRIAKSLYFPDYGVGPSGANVAEEAIVLLANANKAAKSNDWAEAQVLFTRGIGMLLAAVCIYIQTAEDLQKNPPAEVKWALGARAKIRFNQDTPPPYQA
jgi:hypothetical protein